MRAETTSAGSPGGRGWLRLDVIVALVALIVLLPASLAALAQPELRPDGTTTIVVALFVLLHALTFTAVRRPLASLAGASAVMCALALLPGPQAVSAPLFPSSAAYLLVLGQVALQRRWPTAALALGSGVFGAGLIALTNPALVDVGLRLGAFFGLSAGVTTAWAIGLLLRARREQADERTRARVHQAISEERMRISRDLHDVVAHSMTVMIAHAQVAAAVLHDDPSQSERALGVVVDTGREALRGMRAIVVDGDAPHEPTPTVDAITALVEGVRSPNCEVRLVESGVRGSIRPEVALAAHHAVREALTNAVRHTLPPVHVEVRLEWTAASLHAAVDDDGGSGSARSDLGSGTGLVGIGERVRLAGGSMTAEPRMPRGWAVRITLPTEEPNAPQVQHPPDSSEGKGTA